MLSQSYGKLCDFVASYCAMVMTLGLLHTITLDGTAEIIMERFIMYDVISLNVMNNYNVAEGPRIGSHTAILPF